MEIRIEAECYQIDVLAGRKNNQPNLNKGSFLAGPGSIFSILGELQLAGRRSADPAPP